MIGYIPLTRAQRLDGWSLTPDGMLAFYLEQGMYISVSSNGINVSIYKDGLNEVRAGDIADVLHDAVQIYLRT